MGICSQSLYDSCSEVVLGPGSADGPKVERLSSGESLKDYNKIASHQTEAQSLQNESEDKPEKEDIITIKARNSGPLARLQRPTPILCPRLIYVRKKQTQSNPSESENKDIKKKTERL